MITLIPKYQMVIIGLHILYAYSCIDISKNYNGINTSYDYNFNLYIICLQLNI